MIKKEAKLEYFEAQNEQKKRFSRSRPSFVGTEATEPTPNSDHCQPLVGRSGLEFYHFLAVATKWENSVSQFWAVAIKLASVKFRLVKWNYEAR